jgi:type IV pilus assembly protein PilY1
MVLFTNNDGFLYGVDAAAGTLKWGWMPRSLLPKLQSYTSFPQGHYMDGGFAVVDAPDASGSWASYIVGSAQAGAEHFSVKLTLDGDKYPTPSSVLFDQTVGSGSAPGDKAPASTGAAPLHQPVQVAYVWSGSSYQAYYVYVVNVGTTSTLYEVNVATGAVNSAALGVTVTSALTLDGQYNVLWLGDSNGGIWSLPVTGTASADVGHIVKASTTVSPSDTTTPVKPVLYVRYVEWEQKPYVIAVNAQQISVFQVGTNGWYPSWVTTPGGGYVYNATTGKLGASSEVVSLNSTGIVSDVPYLDVNVLTVPVWVPPTDCGAGTAHLDRMELVNGKTPPSIIYKGQTVTTDVLVGSGIAYTSSVSFTNGSGDGTSTGGIANITGAAYNTKPDNPWKSAFQQIMRPSGWRLP